MTQPGGEPAPTPGAAELAGDEPATGAEALAGPDWREGLEEEARGYIENKGWKTPKDMLSSYQSLEHFKGAPPEQLVRVPESTEDAEGWKKVYQRLGAPENVEGYEFPDPVVGEGDYDLQPDFRVWALEAGLSKRQAKAVVERYNAKLSELSEESDKAQAEQSETDIATLKKQWGNEYEANVNAGRKFASAAGLDENTLSQLESVMGTRKLMELTARLGRAVGEHRFAEGRETAEAPFGMTPAAARAKIAELKMDSDFQKIYLDGQAVGHREAVERMKRLHEIANPEEVAPGF